MKTPILVFLLISLVGCRSGEHSKENIYSLIVTKEGVIMQEGYYNGKTAQDIFNVQSITKSVVSLLVGIAIEKGMISSEEERLTEYFPEENLLNTDQKKNISIKHLLNHTSGIEWEGYLEHEGFIKSEKQFDYLLQKEMVAQPGEVYNYNSGGTHLLSIILTKQLGCQRWSMQKNIYLAH